MIDLILTILRELNISSYLINECVETSQEVFLIRRNVDMKRAKDITKYIVTVYRDFPPTEENGKIMRGFASCTLHKSMERKDMEDVLLSTYQSASYAQNPYFPLPEPSSTPADFKENTLDIVTMEQCIQALFSRETEDTTFINSAELFITATDYRILNSSGVDVSFSQTIYSGEFVAQSKLSEDVEIYQDFYFSRQDSSGQDILKKLSDLAASTLLTAKDRSVARRYTESCVPSTIILEGYCVAELFRFFLERCDASMIYPNYSDYSMGTLLPLEADTINLTLKASKPYTSEGIPLQDTKLIQDNRITAITGDSRFSYYLGVPPLGTFSDFELSCGKKSVTDFQQSSYLKIVNFSDFQMDSLSGQFGGEFRLAYYCDGENPCIPVTGGSISGNILDIFDSMMLSKEKMTLNGYSGPRAICYTNCE